MKNISTYSSTISILSLVGITLLSGTILSSVSVSADGDDSSVDNISITVPVACTITPTVDIAHTATINPNTYEDDIGLTTIKTVCNDSNGYSIYAVGYTNEEFGNTNLVGQNTNQTIVTGTATGASSSDPSNWAMKINAVTGTYAPTIENGFSSYHIVPSTWTKVATFASSTDATIGSSIQSTYAAYISGTQAADTYNGKVRYILVHPDDASAPPAPQTTQTGKIRYYANVSDYEGTMADQDIASSITLFPSNFSRTGYGFAGWSDKFDYATNPEAKFYGPMETITLNTADYTGTNPGLSLYAVWVKSQGNLQDSTKVASVCSSLDPAPIDGTANLSSVSALTDQRDNNTYAIAKLADNKCWMIENMRLDNTNSDNSTGALAQGYATNATYGNFAGLANPESPWETSSSYTTANSLYSTDGSNNTTNIGTTDAGYRFPRYNNQNTTSRASAPTTTDNNIYSYGNYYTWAAAIADLNNNNFNNASITNTSICPTGWHLPTGGQTTVNTTADFYTLSKSIMKDSSGNSIEPDQDALNGYGRYGSSVTNATGKTATAAIRSYPNNFLCSSFIYNGSVYSRGSSGGYWSSTAFSGSYAYGLNLGTNVYPGTNYSNKYYGRSIRCLVGS